MSGKQAISLDLGKGKEIRRISKKGREDGSASGFLTSIQQLVFPVTLSILAIVFIMNRYQNQRVEIQEILENQSILEPDLRLAIEQGASSNEIAGTMMAATAMTNPVLRAPATKTPMPETTSTPTRIPIIRGTFVPASEQQTAVYEGRQVEPTTTPIYIPGVVESGFERDEWGFARYSHYWPPLGGANCHGDCVYMASGLPWKDFVEYAIACPASFPFGTRIRFGGEVYECMDRGGAITLLDDGTFWVDFLSPNQRFPYWTILAVEIDYP